MVNASAFLVGLVCSSPPARAQLSVGRRGHDHMSDAAGHSFCLTLHSEWRSSLPAVDTTTGGSCAGAWPPGAFCHFTFSRAQCPKVQQDLRFEPDLQTTRSRPANRVGGRQCQHPTWSQLHQAVLCRGRLCASSVTQTAPTETAQLRATHGTIAHASIPGHCEQVTQRHWTKSANKATAMLNTGGARNSCRENSQCIPHYTRRRRQPGFRENIMWTAQCLWRPALSTFAFSRVCFWDYGLPIMRWNPGRPQLCSAETAHLKSSTAACQSGTQTGSTAVDWSATHLGGRQMLIQRNEVAEGFSSSGTCSGTSSGPESGAWWARGRTPESRVIKRHSYNQDTACTVLGPGTARPPTPGPLLSVPPGDQAELAPAQPKLPAYCQGHMWQGSTQAMSSPCAGPVPLAQGSMMAAPMGSPTVATLGLQPAALILDAHPEACC